MLIEHFKLRRIDRVYKKHFATQPIRGFYQSLEYPNLLIIDKENGRRADAINAGLNLVRYPPVCQTDADCVFEEDTLLRMARPFLLNSNVIGATAFIRPSNGIVVDQGKIVDRSLPKGWLPLFQVVEYLRSFQWARAGLTRMKSMLCMPDSESGFRG